MSPPLMLLSACARVRNDSCGGIYKAGPATRVMVTDADVPVIVV